MSFSELQKLAKSRGIKTHKMKKEDLINMLEGDADAI